MGCNVSPRGCRIIQGLSHRSINWSAAVVNDFCRALTKAIECHSNCCLLRLIYWTNLSPILVKTHYAIWLTIGSCKFVSLRGFGCRFIEEHSVTNLERWLSGTLIIQPLLLVLRLAPIGLGNPPRFSKTLYHLLLVGDYVQLRSDNWCQVLSLWGAWGPVHTTGRKGIPQWSSACWHGMQTAHMVGTYPSPGPPSPKFWLASQ